MDIQGWLQGTTDRAPPDPSDGLPINAHAIIELATAGGRYHRKRPQVASDSTIIAPQRRTREHGKVGDQRKVSGNHRHVNPPVSQPDSASWHHPRSLIAEAQGVTSRDNRGLAQPYEKRVRHKTKADRYEPKAGKDKDQRQPRGQQHCISKRKRYRPHLGGDGKRTERLVQGFKLKNGPRNSRLTLKHDVSAGVFKHGRSSAQVQGRNIGLPDLVFNELRFLQNSKDHQDEQDSSDNARNPGNHHKKPENDREEISAYFSKHKRHNPPREPQVAATQATKRGIGPTRNAQPDVSVARKEGSSPVLPDEELPAVPYLGFGSRGTVNQSNQNPHPSSSASYLTWSESVVELPPPKKRNPNFTTVLKAGQLSAKRQMELERPEPQQQVVQSNRSISVVQGPEHSDQGVRSAHSSTKRQQLPRHEPTTHTDDFEPNLSTRGKILNVTTSQSLPIAPSRPADQQRKIDADQLQAPSSDAKEFRTSDILKLRKKLEGLAEQSSTNAINNHPLSNEEHNVQPPATSPMAALLRSAREALMRNEQNDYTKFTRHSMQQPEESRSDLHETPFRITASVQHNLPGRSMPDMGDVYIADHLNTPAIPAHDHIDQHLVEQEPDTRGGERVPEEDVMYTYTWGIPVHGNFTETPRSSNRMFAAALHGGRPAIRSPLTHTRDVPWSRSGVSETATRKASSQNTFVVRDLSRNEDVAGDMTFEDGLEGFWRPHRLY